MRYQPRLVQPVSTPATVPDPDQVATIWRIWTQASSRDDRMDLHDNYRELIDQALTQGNWETQPGYLLERVVRAGAYLPPVPGDDDDIQRLLSVLSSEEKRDKALDEAKSVTSLPFLFSELSEIIGMYSQTMTILGKDKVDSDEEQDAVWELTTYPDDIVHSICEQLREEQEDTSPVHVLNIVKERNSTLFPVTSRENRARPRPKSKSSADAAYSSARTLDEVSVLVRNDLQGRDMVKDGYPIDVITSHHGNVPEGYWERVDEEIVKPDSGDLMDIYDALEDEFNFHAEDREVPEKK